MHFSTVFLSALSAAAVMANTVKFANLDGTTRTIYFTPNAGLAAIPDLKIPGNTNLTATFPPKWIGNFFSVSEGAKFKPGMLGEVNFNSWADSTYFDVSAIVDPTDVNGVQWLFPAESKLPTSGCDSWPCDNVYNIWNDVQTKSTKETDLICLLGKPSGSQVRRHARDIVAMVKKAIGGEVVTDQNLPRNFITTSPSA